MPWETPSRRCWDARRPDLDGVSSVAEPARHGSACLASPQRRPVASRRPREGSPRTRRCGSRPPSRRRRPRDPSEGPSTAGQVPGPVIQPSHARSDGTDASNASTIRACAASWMSGALDGYTAIRNSAPRAAAARARILGANVRIALLDPADDRTRDIDGPRDGRLAYPGPQPNLAELFAEPR